MRTKRKVVPIADPTETLFAAAEEAAESQHIERELAIPGVKLGTSAFTAAGWPGSFYPAKLNERGYLSYYATKFNSVEIDSTFYRCPPPSTFNRWYDATPPDFVFSLKVPQSITHEKCLLDCDKEMDEFVGRADLLDEKLGVLLLQFGYFNKQAFKSPTEFFQRLRFFLKKYSGTTIRYAVEIRNKTWLSRELADLLREYKVALVLQSQSWVPLPWQLDKQVDPITTQFTYVRLLGDRQGIEKITKTWDRIVVDRTIEIQEWVKYCQAIQRRGVKLYVYINNHYAGFGPASVAQFRKTWDAQTL